MCLIAWTPLSPKSHMYRPFPLLLWSSFSELSEFLFSQAAVLILPQMKLNSWFLHCAFFLSWHMRRIITYGSQNRRRGGGRGISLSEDISRREGRVASASDWLGWSWLSACLTVSHYFNRCPGKSKVAKCEHPDQELLSCKRPRQQLRKTKLFSPKAVFLIKM